MSLTQKKRVAGSYIYPTQQENVSLLARFTQSIKFNLQQMMGLDSLLCCLLFLHFIKVMQMVFHVILNSILEMHTFHAVMEPLVLAC